MRDIEDFEKSLSPANIVKLQAFDLTQPHARVVIGEHERTFTPFEVLGVRVFLPTGISRNPEAFCWRVYHEVDGKVVMEYFIDQEYSGPIAALQDAWVFLVCHLKANPRKGTQKRKGASPKLKTGMIGVAIYRRRYPERQIVALEIRVNQFVEGKLRTRYVGIIRPEDSQSLLDEALVHAYALRRYVDYVRLRGGPLSKMVEIGEVPADFFESKPLYRYRLADLFTLDDPLPIEKNHTTKSINLD